MVRRIAYDVGQRRTNQLDHLTIKLRIGAEAFKLYLLAQFHRQIPDKTRQRGE